MHSGPLYTCLTRASRRFPFPKPPAFLQQYSAYRCIGHRAFSVSFYPCAEESSSKDREPVESVLKRILEPEHAQSIGVARSREPAEEPGSGGSLALVPLNIIYLPPPDWHQPLKPIGFDRKSSVLDKPEGLSGDSFASARMAQESVSQTQEGNRQQQERGQSTSGDSTAVSSLFKWIGKLAKSIKKTARQRKIQKSSPSSSLGSFTLKGTAIEKALDTSKKTITQIRALPKTDDWVTWLGKALSQMTGYTRISELKDKVEESGNEFKKARKKLDSLKQQYTDTVQQRINNQREINSLLQRKHLWNESDVARFTGLYKDEYQAENVELEASRRLKEAEGAVDLKYDMLVSSIRERYHEEQIWSDKIRRASTYGTWAVLIMNILALFLAQAIFEPRKRRKIIDGVDERLGQAMQQQQEKIDDVAQSLAARQESQDKDIVAVAQHLGNVAAVLETVVARQQDTQLNILSNTSNSQVDLSPHIDLGEGYSDSELDMYYVQQQQQKSQATKAQRGFSPAIPGSMIWKAVKPVDKSRSGEPQDKSKTDRTFTRAEAGQLAIETAAVVGCLAAMLTFYFSS